MRTPAQREVNGWIDEGAQPSEQGEAELILGVWWDDRPAHLRRVEVEARDMAGNTVQQSADMAE